MAEINRPKEFQKGTAGVPESTKESARGLPEGSDIGLGPGDRAFEPHYSDQNSSEVNDFRGIFLFFVWYKISIAPEADRKPRRLCLFLL